MKKSIGIVLVLCICFAAAVSLIACDPSGEGEITVPEALPSSAKITNYTLPENFAMTIQVADTQIFNPGDPWYYKTAKIGNDWQIAEYDRNIIDRTKQITHFFKYLAEDSYRHYTYNYETSGWDAQGEVSFAGMLEVSAVNFYFLYKKPTEIQIELAETVCVYDTDPTSNESLTDAIRYEYKDGLEYVFIVDKDYPNICLSKTCRDGATVCVENRAYEYSRSINHWDLSYMLNRSYKPAP